jgi:hypothetical protein
LLRYGAGIVGPYPIFGVRPVEDMGDEWSVVELNRRFREERWPGMGSSLVVSVEHAGNPLVVDETGRVLVLDHDLGGVSLVAHSFEDFLTRRCLKLDQRD